jgi:hypothetical protein
MAVDLIGTYASSGLGRSDDGDIPFEAALEDEVRRAQAEHQALSVAMVRLLESEGPAVGVEELERAAQSAVGDALGVEQRAIIVDEGGAAIWVVLPGVRAKRAEALADRLRELLAEQIGADTTAAVAAYPRDGASADGLVEVCRRSVMEKHGAEQSAST